LGGPAVARSCGVGWQLLGVAGSMRRLGWCAGSPWVGEPGGRVLDVEAVWWWRLAPTQRARAESSWWGGVGVG